MLLRVVSGHSVRRAWRVSARCTRRFALATFLPVGNAGRKPGGSPEGLTPQAWYVGDSVDDARCARAAGVPFIGVAAAASPGREALVALFEAEGARAVVDDINSLEEALAP
jgi:phosphoglycolate phosphatase-like HAD superfamily hydrolase